MGKGIEWMITVAVWVSQLPGAVGRVAAFGTGPLLLVTAGLILVCLLKTPLRWFGCAFVAMGVLLASLTPRPDILVSGDVRAVAVRNAAGRLAVMATGGDQFAIREWLAADGDARTPSDGTLREGWRCDEFGCTARLGDGAVVALPLSVEALDEDCQRARVIVGAHRAPPQCGAKVIDRQFLRQSGALALRRTAAGFEVSAARTAGEDRPWARSAAAQPASDTVRRRPVPAMPGAEDGPDE
jgi:competence protein ComEC